MKKIVSIIIIVVIALSSVSVQAQRRDKEKVKNLTEFDLNPYHFGFIISVNSSNLAIQLKDSRDFNDSLLSIQTISQPGFNLGMLASLDLSPNWHLRFIPTLTFEERILEYTFLESDGSLDILSKNVSSTFIDFPLLFKYRTNRIDNFAVYGIAGAAFSLDVASQKDVNNNREDEAIIKIDNTNFSGILGFGIDFFLPYFKFGIELKSNFGLKNLLIDDHTKFSDPIETIKTRSFIVSFTFEG
jgi:hypothetical protein